MPAWLDVDPRPLDWNGPVDRLFTRFPDSALDRQEYTAAIAKIQYISMGLVAFFLVLTGTALVWMTHRTIKRPMRKALDLANTIQEGDLSQRLAFKSRDEIGMLGAYGAALKTGLNGFGVAIAVTVEDEPMFSLYRGDRADPRTSDNVVSLR